MKGERFEQILPQERNQEQKHLDEMSLGLLSLSVHMTSALSTLGEF